jgi:hypothetical protein
MNVLTEAKLENQVRINQHLYIDDPMNYRAPLHWIASVLAIYLVMSFPHHLTAAPQSALQISRLRVPSSMQLMSDNHEESTVSWNSNVWKNQSVDVPRHSTLSGTGKYVVRFGGERLHIRIGQCIPRVSRIFIHFFFEN